MKYCLGTVQFGLDYGIQGNGQPGRESVFEMISYALGHGIDVLDTASAYGEAEEVLGAYFRAYPSSAGSTKVVSKLKPDAFLNAGSAGWEEIALANATESLERMGLRRFYAYLFHNAGYIFDPVAVHSLYAVKEKGLAERVGVSVYTPEEAMKALEYPEIEAIQIPYNVFDHRLDACGFFQAASERGVIVFARSSLLQGLVMMDPEHLPERVAFAEKELESFRRICSAYGEKPLDAAVGYVGNKPGIDYIVFGVDNISQLKGYLEMMDKILPESMTKEIEEAFSNVEERLVNPVLWK